jgi:two-component system, LytTR family, response regulator
VTREKGRVRVVDLRSVSWVGAEGDYVRFHQKGQSLLLRQTMSSAERELAPRRFLRIHRSAIVNLDFIVEMRPVPGGDCQVMLKDGTLLTLSRTFRKRAALRPASPRSIFYERSSSDATG